MTRARRPPGTYLPLPGSVNTARDEGDRTPGENLTPSETLSQVFGIFGVSWLLDKRPIICYNPERSVARMASLGRSRGRAGEEGTFCLESSTPGPVWPSAR